MTSFPQRQIHLDFHTSPFIPDVGVDFDATEFARTLKAAHVNSVTCFAKCHHGMCYYPTATGASHPATGDRDLLGEQIEALHREGIRVPIYTTMVWEERIAQLHPEWRQMTQEGRFAGDGLGPDGKPGHKGMWKFNNFLDPDYQDHFEAHLLEILDRYGDAVDGFFIDILFFHPDGGWSDASRTFREQHNLMEPTRANFERFQGLAQASFAKRFTPLIQGKQPNATVFYNAQNDGNLDPQVGPRARGDFQTHFEIESLPSGFWGYHHFPRMARMQSHWGKPWLGMTGRFQKMWGDFGGVKPQAALEYECFRAQALGGASSVGDQLPPRGVLDPAAYELIGAVYGQWEEAEPFYEGAERITPPIAILTPNSPGVDGSLSEEGAVMLCQELHYDCDVVDAVDDLSGYQLLILPDVCVLTEELAAKVDAFRERGGKILASHQAVCGLSSLPLEVEGLEELYPTFWRDEAGDLLGAGERVLYSQGTRVVPGSGAQVRLQRVLPYFQRSDLRFSSHFQTPPVAEPDTHPALVTGPGFAYFADPVFRDVRRSGTPSVSVVMKQILEELIGPPAFGDGLSKRIEVYPLRKGEDLLLTLLHYVPVRKSVEIDVMDEASTFAGQLLRLNQTSGRILQVTGGEEFLLGSDTDRVELPDVCGRLCLRVER